MVGIILISFLVLAIACLLFFIIKNIVAPKRVDVIPRLIKQGKTMAAIKMAKQILAKDPKNYIAHYYLGKAYLKEGKTEFAVIEYRLVDENALFGERLNELEFREEYAEILMKQKQNNEALKNYLLLTKLDPQNPNNFYQAGHLYEEANRYDVALGFMQKTIALDKKNAKAHAEIGMMYYRTKMFKEAQNEIATALKLSPDNYSSYYYLGKIQKDSKDYGTAIKSFEKAQRDPEVKQKAIIEHGTCFMLANRFDNAILDFQRAIDLDKESLNQETLYARYFLANCYEKCRKIDKAIEQWTAIYKKAKNFRDVSAKLSEYKDLQANDALKDFLTCSNEEFLVICKNICEAVLKLQVLTNDLKKWGCQITAIDKKDENWMSMRKQVNFIRFYRNPEPIEEAFIVEALDQMKAVNSVKGFVYSASGYSPTAKRFAENRPIELIDKPKLETVLSTAASASNGGK